MDNDVVNRFVRQLSSVTLKEFRSVLRSVKFNEALKKTFSESVDSKSLCKTIQQNSKLNSLMKNIGYNWLLTLSVLYKSNRYKPADNTAARIADSIVTDGRLIDKRYVNVLGYQKHKSIYNCNLFLSKNPTFGEYFCRKLMEYNPIVQKNFSEFILDFMRMEWINNNGSFENINSILSCINLMPLAS